MKKSLGIGFLLILFFLSFLGFRPDDKLHLIVCDVGEGDAILLQKKSYQVLIDGGPNDKVLKCLSDHLPFWDKTVELVINTHQDKDHLAGLNYVIERYDINQIVINSLAPDTEVFKKFQEKVREKKITVYSPQAGDKLKVEEMEFEVLWPREKLGDLSLWQKDLASADYEKTSQVLGVFDAKINNTSIALWLSYKDFEAFLPGDIDKEVEGRIEIPKFAEVLKVPHHGSKNSSSKDFLEKVKPQLSIISVGKNSFGHPTEETLERLEKIGSQILRTDKEGEIEVVSDGKSWQVFSK